MATTKEWAMRQLLVHSRLGKHFAQILGHIPFIAERAVGPAEHIAGELERHCLVHAEECQPQDHPVQSKSTFQE
jgi:hypothetical protein